MKPIQNISKDPIAREKVEEAQQDISGIENPEFTEAATRANINSKESLPTLFGKIKKWFTDLKTVAFSGSYTDLSDKPTIPAAQVNSDWNATSGVAKINNKPTIPTVNNATLTIQKNGTNVQTFTANASSNVTCNITMSKSDVGLGNVDNTADADKTVASSTTASKLGSSTLGGSNQPIYLNAGTATKCNTFVPSSGGTFNAAGGTAGTEGWTTVTVGNSTGAATAKNSAGRVRLYRGNGASATTAYYTEIRPGANTANRTITFPNAGGTVALTSSNITGTSANVTGTVAIANGGTGATSRLNALKALTNEDVGANATHFLTITNNWAKGGYTNVANAKSVLGLKDLAYIAKGSDTTKYLRNDGTWVKPPNDNTTYSAGTGISLSGTTFSNSGVRSIATGSSNGTISVNTNGTSANVAVKGLGSLAYKSSLTYSDVGAAASSHTHSYLPLSGGDLTGSVSFKNGKGINLYNAANNNFSDLANSDNGTLKIRSLYGWLNLQTNNQVQCRNAGDSAWVNIAAANVSSSRRFKENIEDLSDEEAKKILNVRTVRFDFKEKYSPSDDWEHERFNQVGVIAEEVDSIIPNVVRYDNYENPEEDPVPTFVEYSHFAPYLIKMCQLQQEEINKLKEQVNILLNINS